MDDVDAVQAQLARNMLDSGDWVTPTLDGVKYLEKAPLWYWMIAASYKLLGVSDWVARLPVVLSCVFLCWITCEIGSWAFGRRQGLFAGIALATCLGMFLFTRILIPDVCLTAFTALALWAFMRAIDPAEQNSRAWAWTSAAAIAIAILLKGLIGAVFPIAIACIYLVFTAQWRRRLTWRKLHVFTGGLILLSIAAPWHVIATLRNPPAFVWTLHSGPGEYKGFFWFYFVNEHLLRFLNLRYPRDYNTVPRLWFWVLHLVWLFPWSVFLPAAARLSYRGEGRAVRVRLLALIWIAFVLTFFTFSTTQEYYSMPAYPAFALLIGSAVVELKQERNRWIIGSICAAAFAVTLTLLIASGGRDTSGDISRSLVQHPSAYTLSMGHMGDLTIASFAYLRWPLAVAALAFAIGAVGSFAWRGHFHYLSLAGMMVIFFHAARLAMVVFDPYLSSRPLANALLRLPAGTVIFDDQYYTFSSVAFYTNRRVLLLNGRVNNLEYGSNAPGAARVFIDDRELKKRWALPERCYLLAEATAVPRLSAVLELRNLHVITQSGGKFLFSNGY